MCWFRSVALYSLLFTSQKTGEKTFKTLTGRAVIELVDQKFSPLGLPIEDSKQGKWIGVVCCYLLLFHFVSLFSRDRFRYVVDSVALVLFTGDPWSMFAKFAVAAGRLVGRPKTALSKINDGKVSVVV